MPDGGYEPFQGRSLLARRECLLNNCLHVNELMHLYRTRRNSNGCSDERTSRKHGKDLKGDGKPLRQKPGTNLFWFRSLQDMTLSSRAAFRQHHAPILSTLRSRDAWRHPFAPQGSNSDRKEDEGCSSVLRSIRRSLRRAWKPEAQVLACSDETEFGQQERKRRQALKKEQKGSQRR